MKNKKRLIVAVLAVVLLLALAPKKLSWFVPGPASDVTGYILRELHTGSGAYDPTQTGVEELRAALGDTWVLWWGFSNSIPSKDGEGAPVRLEIYTDELVPAGTFTLGPDGLLYTGNRQQLRLRPLNTGMRETLEVLDLQ